MYIIIIMFIFLEALIAIALTDALHTLQQDSHFVCTLKYICTNMNHNPALHHFCTVAYIHRYLLGNQLMLSYKKMNIKIIYSMSQAQCGRKIKKYKIKYRVTTKHWKTSEKEGCRVNGCLHI